MIHSTILSPSSRLVRRLSCLLVAIVCCGWFLGESARPVTAQTANLMLRAVKTHWLYTQTTRQSLRADGELRPMYNYSLDGAPSWWINVYEKKVDGNVDLFLNPYILDRNSPVFAQEYRLTTHPGIDFAPQLSPDVKSVLFVSNRDGNDELYLVNIATLVEERLTDHPGLDNLPKWSPDGTQIAFISDRDGDAEIYLMSLKTKELTQLTNNAEEDIFVSWSPDGSQLAWVQLERVKINKLTVERRYLAIMDATGANQRRITAHLPYGEFPAWSPNGQTIAFDYDATGDGTNDIALIDINGENLRILLTGFAEENVFAQEYSVMGWLPDEKSLYVNSTSYGFSDGWLTYGDFQTNYIYECCAPDNIISSIAERNETTFHKRHTDAVMGRTWVEPLPTYSRGPMLPYRIHGYDELYAGLAEIDIYTRNQNDSGWPSERSNFKQVYGDFVLDPAPILLYEGYIGETVSLKSNGKDRADNREPLLTDDAPQAETTLYQWLLTGQLSDNRGYPVVEQPVPIDPTAMNVPVTDATGHFDAYIDFSFEYSITQHVAVDVNMDRQQNAFVGSTKQTLLAAGPIELNAPCTGFCLTRKTIDFGCDSTTDPECVAPEEELDNIQGRYGVEVIADKIGGVHFLWYEENKVTHQYRNLNGTWSAPSVLTLLQSQRNQVIGYRSVVDANNRLQFLWAQNTTPYSVYQTFLDVGGSWAPTVRMGTGRLLKLLPDEQNRLHLLYSCDGQACQNQQSQLFYQVMDGQGEWSEAEPIIDGIDLNSNQIVNDAYPGDMAVDSTGMVHFAYGSTPGSGTYGSIMYRTRSPSGNWSKPASTVLANGIEQLKLLVDAEGTLHFFWIPHFSQWHYITKRRVDTGWSYPIMIPIETYDFAAYFDKENTLRIQNYRDSNDIRIFSRFRPSNGIWSEPEVLVDQGRYSERPATITDMTIDGRGKTHIVVAYANNEYPYYYAEQTPGPQSAISSQATYSTTFAVPTTFHQPTLSFLYDLYDTEATTDVLSVDLFDGEMSTPIFTTSASAVEKVGWADLSAWTGETVTVTFTLRQPTTGGPHVYARLQTLTLDEWLTPIPLAVTPMQIEANAKATVHLTGTNFINTPTVTLGGRPLINVSRQSETALDLEIPANMPPGRHDLVITNEGSISGVLFGALQVGELVYLPMVATD